MNIREEREHEYRLVEDLTKKAFWDVYRPGCDEHVLVHFLRMDASYLPELSRVLEEDGQIIGHIMYALGSVLTAQGEKVDLPTFGPVSILPHKQKYGYGSILINHTLELTREAGYPGIVIFGNEQYYRRFGFESASLQGLSYAGMPQGEAPWFMLKVFDAKRMAEIKGMYSNPSCYEVTQEMINAYARK